MTIWILVVVLLASLAGLGYRQGAIRVAASLVGIVVAALLAVPLAPLLKPVMAALGVKNLLLAWVIPPLVVFVIINSLFKAGALVVHRKVDVYFKYKAGDLRLALWERLNARLGLCLGLINGTFYLVLISMVIYAFGYWTVQLSTSEGDPWPVRLFNRVAHDLESTGLARVAKAIDPMPTSYYDAADLAGLLYVNPLAESRLARYPALFALGQREEFQQLAKDGNFAKLRQTRAAIREVLNYPAVDGMINNPELLRLVWTTVLPDLQDLTTFLETGKSAKYDGEKLLGQWAYDFNNSFSLFRKANPKMSAAQLKETRRWMSGLFVNTTLTVGTDGFVLMKSLPQIKPVKPGEPAQAPEFQNLTGKWNAAGGGYQMNFEQEGRKADFEASLQGERLTVKGGTLPMVFERDTDI
jgi:hypothetical protein